MSLECSRLADARASELRLGQELEQSAGACARASRVGLLLGASGKQRCADGKTRLRFEGARCTSIFRPTYIEDTASPL